MKKYFLFLFAFLAVAALHAQEQNFNAEADVPLMPNAIYGKLDNGLTYYILENEMPENRAEFYLVVNAGAILEDESQNGLAHFCEHMCFNGTENFEKHDIIQYLQSIGMKFGPEINAFTSHDNTTYMLQKVPLEDPANVDTALMILYDWANNVSFEGEEIDKERGVIHEEWRTGRSAMFRLMNKSQKVLFKGSKYATHDVIGDIEIIDNAPYEEFRRYYRDWYRPDLQAIIAVGDFDGAAMEAQIKDVFGKAPKRENPRFREEFPVPDHQETYVTINTDPEAQYNFIQIYWKHDPPTKKDMGYLRSGMVEQIYAGMLNARLQELTIKEDPPFMFGVSMYSSMTRTKDAYMAFAVSSNEKIKKALEALLVENERVKLHGFTATELERAKDDYLSQLESRYKEKDKQESSEYVWEFSSHFLEGEPAPGIEYLYEYAQMAVPGISLEELNNLAKTWISDENRVIAIAGPESSREFMPTTEEVLATVAAISDKDIPAYVDKVSDAPLVADIPAPGEIEKKKKDKKLETETWQLSNGIEIVFKPTDFKDDEILMSAYSFGGTSVYGLDDLMSAQNCTDVVARSGLAGFDETELQKKLAGKVVNVYPYVGGVSEGFNGSCTPEDFETMMKLVYLYFTQPRKDETAFNAYMDFMEGILSNKQNDPASAFQDTILVTMANYNPRVRPMTTELLDEISFKKLHYIYNERFGDPGSFTFFFVGNIEPAEVENLILTYLGGLPVVKRNESWKDNGVRPPAGNIQKKVIRDMEIPKGTVSINFVNVYDNDNAMERMELATLCDILSVRYTESIREEQGGTYGVRVYDRQYKYPWEHYEVRISFDCAPENVDKLKAIVYEEINKLKAEGPLQKDLKGVKENLLKTRTENLERNRFWLNTLSNMYYFERDPGGIFKYDDMVKSMSVESLKDAANKLLDLDHIEIVMVPAEDEAEVEN
ncbi:MAG: insulinase family protein [Bacteroidales bacterium]|jgi:zinc protease|nr:insulinase family protein [Bacteroidales bacterium]